MIEQLISTQSINSPKLAEVSAPLSANANDVTRFNMELSNHNADGMKTQSHLLQDVSLDSSKIDNHLLQEKVVAKTPNPLIQLDRSYKNVMSELTDFSQFEKFMDINKNKKKSAIRTNIEEVKISDPAEEVKVLLDKQSEMISASRKFGKIMSQWRIKTNIWTANISILTTLVGQASQGFKTLFRSAG